MQVEYNDGDRELLWLPLEEVRLCMAPGEQLEAPNAACVRTWADALAATKSGGESLPLRIARRTAVQHQTHIKHVTRLASCTAEQPSHWSARIKMFRQLLDVPTSCTCRMTLCQCMRPGVCC